MKKRYLPIIAISAALFTWNCGENSSNNSSNDDTQSVSELPYYVAGYTIDPATGTVYNLATGEVAGQLNADGTITDAAGNIFLAADTTLLPNITSLGYLVDNNGNVTDISGNVIGTLNADGKSITLTDGSMQDLSGNVISEATATSSATVASSSSITADPSATVVASVVVGDIYSDLTVRDANGNVIGTFDADSGYITLTDGTVVDTNGSVISEASSASFGTSSAANGNSSASFVNSSASEITSSASQQQQGSITVTGNLTQSAAKNTSISTIVFSGVTAEPSRNWTLSWLTCAYDQNAKTYTVSGTVPDWFAEGTSSETFTFSDATFTLTLTVGNASTVSSSSVQAVSSSSVWSSSSVASSSSAKSSSSVASSSSRASTNGYAKNNLVVVSGGASGSGWATRYWDCCKPSCSWTNNAGSGNEAKTCTASGTVITDLNATSACNGGTAATCTSQIPMIIDDSTAYAFAAVPASNGGQCGHCYALTFTGTGKYESKSPQQALKGKVLVVMASNVGADVEQGQFDVMIPGGGVGIYNGCSGMGWGSDMGQQYGGLLSDCETSVGYSYSGATLISKRAECLTNKCNSTFANDAVAKEGCLFLATWMSAAGNPNHTYVEVECPAELKAKY
ncbi:MAG: glycosyl hydrolase family 5 [Fibrobacter sp.]|nr:glycosyl hydrolase family 5 [Fibrobacter sp.]